MESEIKVIDVTVPFSLEQIKSVFENNNNVYYINYKDSELKGPIFLTYLANLEIPAEVNLENSTYEEKEELIKVYMETRNLYECPSLLLNIINIMFQFKGVDTTNMINHPVFSPKEVTTFINSHKELVTKWVQFIESSILFAMNSLNPDEDSFEIKKNFPVINDANYIGANIVFLFSIPSFYENFIAIPPKTQLSYFQQQFEEYMFKGKNLYHFYQHENNMVVKLLEAHLNNSIDYHSIKSMSEIFKEINFDG